MNHRLYLGLGILILLLIAGGTFLFYSQYNELQQLKQDAEEADKLLEDNNKPIADNEPPDAREGFKMVPHDDHFHEVPIDAPDTWQDAPHKTQQTSVPKSQPNIGPAVRTIGGVRLDANGYIILDMSFLDNPEKAMEEIAEVLLHPDRYLPIQIGEARQKDSILSRKIRDHYYGKGSYGDKYENADRLNKLRDDTYMNEVRRMLGIDIEAIEAAVKSGQPYAIQKPQLPKDMPLPGEDSK